MTLKDSLKNMQPILPTILALDEYATIIALVDRAVTPIYHRQFWEFIQAIEESGYASGYLEGEPSVLSKVLKVFVRASDEATIIPKRQIS